MRIRSALKQMEVKILESLPPEWANKKPLSTYETRFLYTGVSRYDVETKMISSFEKQENKILYRERPFQGVLSKSYATELVRVIVYSQSPKIWAEELSPQHIHFFQQMA